MFSFSVQYFAAIYRVCQKCIHIVRDVIYILLFEVELNYGNNV